MNREKKINPVAQFPALLRCFTEEQDKLRPSHSDVLSGKSMLGVCPGSLAPLGQDAQTMATPTL